MARPFIPAYNCAGIELIYSYQGQVCENTFKVKQDQPYSGGDLSNMIAASIAWFSNHYKTRMAVQSTLFRVRARGLDAIDSPIKDEYLANPIPGTNANGFPMPPNVAFCVKWSTGRGGRSYRGRWFCLAMCANDTTLTGQVTANYANAVVQDLRQLQTDIGGYGSRLQVVSYRSDKTWRDVAIPTEILEPVVVDYNLDSMRRRLPGRGRT